MDKSLARLTKGKREYQNQQDYKCKRRHYNQYHRYAKNHKRLLWTTVCQQTG